ncbi:hypothetical protein KDN34_05595 [Shewanella yunxiaonensis]|uniref:DNA polymerase III subunit beta n=1 Tax=Shewanella yunxiaonensis TaxID=2829809 RepID=A0ABX7YVT3_9GAMM|nr:hypothetical protein [Shewanella yunxiaonensis]QUN06917.1 hypothetical protein KDN34_05595 [Shewanella yunxiaonensis]
MKLVIPASQRSILHTAIDCIDSRYAESTVLFITNKAERTLTIVSGQMPRLAQCTLFLDGQSPHIQDTQFALDTGFCKRLLDFVPQQTRDIELGIVMKRNEARSVTVIDESTVNNDTLGLSCGNCLEINKKHTNYLTSNSCRPFISVTKKQIQEILAKVSQLMPFDFIEINRDQQTIKVQTGNSVVHIPVAEHIEIPPLHMILTPSEKELLETLCNDPSEENIEIAQQGIELTFQTKQRIITCELSDKRTFGNINSLNFRQILSSVINFRELQRTVKKWQKAHKDIKRSDTVLIHFHAHDVLIYAITEKNEHASLIKVYGNTNFIDELASNLFHFSARKLTKIQSAKLIDSAKTRVDVLVDNSDVLKLAIFRSIEDKEPSDSLFLEKAEQHLPKVLKLQRILQAGQQRVELDDSQKQYEFDFLFD